MLTRHPGDRWAVHVISCSDEHAARWDHPTVPPNARSVAVAADRTEGDIIIEGVGEDSGESEWWVTGLGDIFFFLHFCIIYIIRARTP